MPHLTATDNWSALHIASYRCAPDNIIQSLIIDYGVDCKIKTKYGNTPSEIAFAHGFLVLASLIEQLMMTTIK
jgi:ankyrin repeat protein